MMILRYSLFHLSIEEGQNEFLENKFQFEPKIIKNISYAVWYITWWDWFEKVIWKFAILNFKKSSWYLLVQSQSRNTRTVCEICSKLTRKIAEQRQGQHSVFFIVNFEQISDIVVLFPLFPFHPEWDWIGE